MGIPRGREILAMTASRANFIRRGIANEHGDCQVVARLAM